MDFIAADFSTVNGQESDSSINPRFSGKKIMDSASINPARGPDIRTAKPPTSSGKPVSNSPVAEVKTTVDDTVTLSPAGKSASNGRGTPVVTQDGFSRQPPPANASRGTAERPDSRNGSLIADNSSQFSITDANEVVLKIIDNKTQEVVKQIPSEEELQLRSAIRAGVEAIVSKNNTTEKLI